MTAHNGWQYIDCDNCGAEVRTDAIWEDQHGNCLCKRCYDAGVNVPPNKERP